VVSQQIPGGEIYPALEKGTIDAAEWVGPYDDEKLGLHKVAKFYYAPGWWKAAPQIHLFTNLEKWNALPPSYKTIVRTAADATNMWMTAKYDAVNPPALKKLVSEGALLRIFPQPVMEASLKAANEGLCGDFRHQCGLQEDLGQHQGVSAISNTNGGRSRNTTTIIS